MEESFSTGNGDRHFWRTVSYVDSYMITRSVREPCRHSIDASSSSNRPGHGKSSGLGMTETVNSWYASWSKDASGARGLFMST